MNSEECIVATPNELVSATRNREVRKINVSGSVTDAPSVRLSPGQALWGKEIAPRFVLQQASMECSLPPTTRFETFASAPPRISDPSSMTQASKVSAA